MIRDLLFLLETVMKTQMPPPTSAHPGSTPPSMTYVVKVVGDGLNLGPVLNPAVARYCDKEGAGSFLQAWTQVNWEEVCRWLTPNLLFLESHVTIFTVGSLSNSLGEFSGIVA